MPANIKPSSSCKNMLIVMFIGWSIPAHADNRVQVFNRCMAERNDKMYCQCRIIENPHYPIPNMMIKIMAAQECAKMYGDK